MTRLDLEYYTAEQSLVRLIRAAFEQNFDAKISRRYSLELLVLVRSWGEFSRNELNDISVRFSDWLDDFDIRATDPEYHILKTSELLEWCKKHDDSQNYDRN
jgi:hypothetical protein